jgi:hypothetical protein
VLVAALALTVVPASADVLFDNSSFSDLYAAWQINGGFQVSDSFQLTSNATLTGINLLALEYPGDSLTNLVFSIGASPLGSDVVFGQSAQASDSGLTDTYLYTYPDSGDIDDISLLTGATPLLAALRIGAGGVALMAGAAGKKNRARE